MPCLYRLVDKFTAKLRAVSEASDAVTKTVLQRQYELRKDFLDQVSSANYCEYENMRQWRKVVVMNTHPRALWCKDERRTLWWQLDPTEGPGRMRKRMMRVPRFINAKHLLPEARRHSTSSEGI